MPTLPHLITIVIPVHNRATVIERTLDSILNQDMRPVSLILVDNNSTDNSLAIMEQWKSRHQATDFNITITTENTKQSAAAARNKGLSLVTTPYVMFFDSDDTMRPSHLRRATQAFHDDPELDIAGWDILFHSADGKTSLRPFADRNALFRHTFNATLSTLRYAVSTSLIRAVGGWNDSVLGWDDYELGMRLLERNPKMLRLGDEITVDVFETKVSLTGSDYSSRPHQWEGVLNLCERYFKRNQWNNGWINLRRVILAALYARELSPEATRLLNETLRSEHSFYKKIAYKFAYSYTKHGGRGIHLILRHIL